MISAAARVIPRLSFPHEVRLARRKSFGRVVNTDAGGAGTPTVAAPRFFIFPVRTSTAISTVDILHTTTHCSVCVVPYFERKRERVYGTRAMIDTARRKRDCEMGL